MYNISLRLSVCTEGGSSEEYMALFTRTIEGNEDYLVRKIEVEGLFWTELRTRKVLTEDLLELCQNEVFVQ